MKPLWSSMCLAALAAATPSSSGGVYLTDEDCDPTIPPSAYEVESLGGGHWNVYLYDLYKPTEDSYFEIHGTTGEIIDNIFIEVDGPLAGSPVIVRVLPDCNIPTSTILTVHNIIQTGTAQTLLNMVEVEQDIGTIVVEAIGNLEAGRDIYGDIVATTGDNPIQGINVAHAGRDIVGNLSAPLGRIAFVVCDDGSVGTPTDPVVIEAKHEVRYIDAAEVHADINTRLNGGIGTISHLVADTFTGSLITTEIATNFQSEGRLEFFEALDADISIGKSFAGANRSIIVPTEGLTTQITINADNLPSATWTAPVKVGPDGDPDQVVLADPAYSQTAISLGGGSVGLAPFQLHDESCSPANGALVRRAASDPALEVRLRHYGPVTWSATPLTVVRRLIGSSDPHGSAGTFDFSTVTSDPRSVEVAGASGQPGFEIGYEYLIEPTTNLKCDEVAALPAVASYDYVITVTCSADLTGDGLVDGLDLALLLGSWGPCPGCPADFDGNGEVDGVDLAVLLGAWGSCTGGGEGMSGFSGGSEDGSELEAALWQLGWPSVETYLAWLASASDAEGLASGYELLDLLQ